MRIAICDDSVYDRDFLRELLGYYSQQNNILMTIVEYNCGEALLSEFVETTFDLIFIDIYMGDLDGIQVAKMIRQIDDNCSLVFISASKEHALAGFEVNALHYLNKPVEFVEICEVFKRCKKKLSIEDKSIEVVFKRIKLQIPIKIINYVEVFNKTCFIYTNTEIFRTYCTLEEIMQKIDSDNFLHCHRSYIINMQAVGYLVNNDFILKTGVLIPIRQAGKQVLKKKYLEYILNYKRKNNKE